MVAALAQMAATMAAGDGAHMYDEQLDACTRTRGLPACNWMHHALCASHNMRSSIFKGSGACCVR